MSRQKLAPIHPGALLEDELEELGLGRTELARALHVSMNRISAIVNGKRSITVDTAMRLARYFGTSAQYWLNLQLPATLFLPTKDPRTIHQPTAEARTAALHLGNRSKRILPPRKGTARVAL
jgi:addiction module HigA family antidote